MHALRRSFRLITLLAALACFGFVTGHAQTLQAGQYLAASDVLRSANGQWSARLQADGNVCTDHISTKQRRSCLRNESAPQADYSLHMHRDGDLCLRKGSSRGVDFAKVWCAGTSREGGQRYQLAVRDDGVLALHALQSDSSVRGEIWNADVGSTNLSLVGAQYRSGALEDCGTTIGGEASRLSRYVLNELRHLPNATTEGAYLLLGRELALLARDAARLRLEPPLSMPEAVRLTDQCTQLADQLAGLSARAKRLPGA